MKLFPQKFLLLLVIIILIAIPTYLYTQREKTVRVKNESNSYAAVYRETDLSKHLIETWGLWEEHGIFLESDGQNHTVKTLEIIPTDEEQPYHTHHSEGENKLLFSTNEYISASKKLVLKVYMAPEFAQSLSEEEITSAFSFIVFARIADMTLNDHTDEGKFKQVKNFHEEIIANPSENPFEVTKK